MGIIIGLLLLLVTGAAIAVVVLYMMRRKQAKGNYSAGRKGNGKLCGLGKQVLVPCTLSYYIYALADNLVYGNSTGDIEIANTDLLEASMYEEVPDTAIGDSGGTGHENTQTARSTHAISTMYEYATLEPPMVSNFLSDSKGMINQH